ncbi:MAG TPA: flagellar basal body P-ring formation chaperone FlgA [Gemmatimonadaceae bacterium]|nr:flagellar basal body P-ring formation chaperone FlgA [Gemmatimonadaceae bacterium]
MTRRLLHPLTLILIAAAVALSARLAAAQQVKMRVAVAARALPRGAVLGDSDFVFRDTTVWANPDATPIAPGWVTRRVIAAGEVLRQPAVEPPVLVSANEPVEVEFRDGNVRLSIAGTAARDGALGERVPVRTELGHRIEGTVVARGRVRID